MSIKHTIIIILLLIAIAILLALNFYGHGYAKGQLDALNGKQMYVKKVRPADTIIINTNKHP